VRALPATPLRASFRLPASAGNHSPSSATPLRFRLRASAPRSPRCEACPPWRGSAVCFSAGEARFGLRRSAPLCLCALRCHPEPALRKMGPPRSTPNGASRVAGKASSGDRSSLGDQSERRCEGSAVVFLGLRWHSAALPDTGLLACVPFPRGSELQLRRSFELFESRFLSRAFGASRLVLVISARESASRFLSRASRARRLRLRHPCARVFASFRTNQCRPSCTRLSPTSILQPLELLVSPLPK
jgi:hypothetical protein